MSAKKGSSSASKRAKSDTDVKAEMDEALRGFFVSKRDNSADITLKHVRAFMEERFGVDLVAQHSRWMKERSKEVHLEVTSGAVDGPASTDKGKKRPRREDSTKKGDATGASDEGTPKQKPSKKGHNVMFPAEPSTRMDSSFDSAMFAPRGGSATSEQNSVEFFAEFEQIMGRENQRRFDHASSQFVHPSVYIDKIVKQGAFKSVAAEVPIMFSPHYVGHRGSSQNAVSMQLGKHLFRYKHDLGGMPLSHSAFEVKGETPLVLKVHPELKGWLTFAVLTNFLVLAPAVGSSIHIAITSLDRNRANGRCIATVLFLCEVRFEAASLGKYFKLHEKEWTTHDGMLELSEGDVIQVRTARVSSGESGVSIALDVEPMPDEMEVIKPDGSVYVVNSSGDASMTQFLHPVKEAEPSTLVPASGTELHQEEAPQQEAFLPITIRVPALYNTKLDIQVRPKDLLRSLQTRVAHSQQLPVDSVQVTDLVLVRTNQSLWPADSFAKAGVLANDIIVVKTEAD